MTDAPERFAAVTIDEHEVVLLQMKESPRINIKDVVFLGFVFHLESRRRGTTWLAFHRADKDATWLGFAKGTPAAVIAGIQQAFEAAGLEVQRSAGRALQLRMTPFARLSDDGLEELISSGDPVARRVVERSGAKPVARGYTAQKRATTTRQAALIAP